MSIHMFYEKHWNLKVRLLLIELVVDETARSKDRPFFLLLSFFGVRPLFLANLLLILLKIVIIWLLLVLVNYPDRCEELLLLAFAFAGCLRCVRFRGRFTHVLSSFTSAFLQTFTHWLICWILRVFNWQQFLILACETHFFLLFRTFRVRTFLSFVPNIVGFLLWNETNLVFHQSRQGRIFWVRIHFEENVGNVLEDIIFYCFDSAGMFEHKLT